MYAVAKNEIHMDNSVLPDSVLLQAAVFNEAAQFCISWIAPMTLSDPCEHTTHIATNRRNIKCLTYYVELLVDDRHFAMLSVGGDLLARESALHNHSCSNMRRAMH